jgi:hypothetical protein
METARMTAGRAGRVEIREKEPVQGIHAACGLSSPAPAPLRRNTGMVLDGSDRLEGVIAAFSGAADR